MYWSAVLRKKALFYDVKKQVNLNWSQEEEGIRQTEGETDKQNSADEESVLGDAYFVSSFSIEILPIKFRLWFALFKLHFVIDPFLFLESQRTKQVYVDFSFLVTLNTMRTSDTKTLEFIMNRKCTNKQNKFVVAYFRLFSDNLFSNWVDIY